MLSVSLAALDSYASYFVTKGLLVIFRCRNENVAFALSEIWIKCVFRLSWLPMFITRYFDFAIFRT